MTDQQTHQPAAAQLERTRKGLAPVLTAALAELLLSTNQGDGKPRRRQQPAA